jgi:hypothetical protein
MGPQSAEESSLRRLRDTLRDTAADFVSKQDQERFWDTMWDLTASHIEGHKAQIALVEAKIAKMERRRFKRGDSPLDRLARLPGPLGGLGPRPAVGQRLAPRCGSWAALRPGWARASADQGGGEVGGPPGLRRLGCFPRPITGLPAGVPTKPRVTTGRNERRIANGAELENEHRLVTARVGIAHL